MNQPIWKTEFVSSDRCQIEYKIRKNHPELPWMVFFHGFGQDSQAFESVFEILNLDFNMLSVHIFYHGNSTLEGKSPLRKEEWKRMLSALFLKERIEIFHITAFSMGCKFALTTLELFPDKIRSLQLLAPDGVVMNPWYRLATQTVAGRMCLRLMIAFAPFFRGTVWFLGKIKLVKPAVGRFAEHQMGSEEQRQLVSNVWINFRRMWPDWKRLPVVIEQHTVKIQVVLGKYDTIISPEKFQPQRPEWKQFEWKFVDSGHSKLVELYAKQRAKSSV